jgi:hypothetical protein
MAVSGLMTHSCQVAGIRQSGCPPSFIDGRRLSQCEYLSFARSNSVVNNDASRRGYRISNSKAEADNRSRAGNRSSTTTASQTPKTIGTVTQQIPSGILGQSFQSATLSSRASRVRQEVYMQRVSFYSHFNCKN